MNSYSHWKLALAFTASTASTVALSVLIWARRPDIAAAVFDGLAWIILFQLAEQCWRCVFRLARMSYFPGG